MSLQVPQRPRPVHEHLTTALCLAKDLFTFNPPLLSNCTKSVDAPLAVAIHAVEAVPLSIQLRESVSDLSHFSGRSIPNGVRLALVDPCDLLPQTFQVVFDVL